MSELLLVCLDVFHKSALMSNMLAWSWIVDRHAEHADIVADTTRLGSACCRTRE